MNYADYYSQTGGGQSRGYQNPMTPYGQHPYQQGGQYGQGRQFNPWSGYGYRPMGGGGGYRPNSYHMSSMPSPQYGWGMPQFPTNQPRYQQRYKHAGQTGPVMPYDPSQGGPHQSGYPYGGMQPYNKYQSPYAY